MTWRGSDCKTARLYCGVLCCAGLTAALLFPLWPSPVAVCGLPRVRTRRLLPDHHTLARDSVTALQWFYPLGQWLQQASFHFSFCSFLQLSISALIRPINLESFQQSLYYYSLKRRVFTQAQFLDISSSSLQSNESTPTSAVPEWEDIFPLFLFITWLGLSSVWVHRVSLACYPAD